MLHAGIDLGGTKIEIRVLDHSGSQQFLKRVETPRGCYESTINSIVNLITDAEIQLKQSCTVGVGIPGAIDSATGVIKNANSTWLIGKALDQDLQTRLSRPIKVANDADCLTLSEAVDGAAANSKLVFGVIMGTGVGGGICFNQQLLSGPNAICGEWGHNPLPWAEADDIKHPCFCGKEGCIETFISGPGFCNHYQQLSGQDTERVESIIAAAETGNEHAVKSLDLFFEQAAKSLSGVINILDPDCIVLAGGLSNIKALYHEIPKRWQQYVISETVKTKLAHAQFGDSSGARGAAWLGKTVID